jgi:hypothetical protein
VFVLLLTFPLVSPLFSCFFTRQFLSCALSSYLAL